MLGERTYNVHGIRVSVVSEWTEFLTLTDLMLGPFRGSAAGAESLSVRIDVHPRPWLESPSSNVRREGDEERLGTEEFLEGGIARFKTDKVRIEYHDGPEAAVNAAFVLDRRSRLRGLWGSRPPWEDMFALFRLGIEEPILLKLGRRGAVLLHASAASSSGRAVVLLGLNGSGKSTLCASLLSRLDYLSDNFAAWDGQAILGFPCALRVPGEASARDRGVPSVYGRILRGVDPAKTRTTGTPHALVFLSLGSETAISPIPAEDAFRRLLRVRDMVHEFPEHTFLGPLASPQDLGRTEELARRVPAFRLVMSRTEDARERILELL